MKGERCSLDQIFRQTFDFLPGLGYEFVRPERWFNAAAIGGSQFLAVMHEERDGLTLVFLGLLSERVIPDYAGPGDIFDIDDVRETVGAEVPPRAQPGPQHSQSVLDDAASFLRTKGVPELRGPLLERLRTLMPVRDASRWEV